MEGFGGSVKAVLRADGGKPRGVFGTVAQLITTDQKYGVALETALGGAMQNLIVENENAAKQWIRFYMQKHDRTCHIPAADFRAGKDAARNRSGTARGLCGSGVQSGAV